MRILIDVGGDAREELTALAAQIRAIDDSVTIDVDTRGVAAAQSKLASLGVGGAVADGGGVPDGGISHSFSATPNTDFMRRLFGVDMPSVQESFDMPGITDRGGLMHDLRRGLSRMNEMTNDLSLSMSDFHNALASLLPLLFVFIGGLPAAITALTTLATAAFAAAAGIAAIGGLGLLGLATQRGDGDLMAGFTDIFNELKDAFLEAFQPLADQFIPIARDALSGIEMLFNAIAARGPLLSQLRDDARAFGGFMLDMIPSLLGALGNLAEAFGPLFGQFAEWLEGTDILAGFVQVSKDATGPLTLINDALLTILPPLIDMSLGFLDVTGAIMTFLNVVTRLLGFFKPLLDMLGLTGRNFGMLAGATFVLITLVSVLTQTYAALSALLSSRLGAAIIGHLGRLNAWIAAKLGLTAATWQAYLATAALLGLLTLGLAPVIGALSSHFLGLSENIDRATSSLDRFGSTRNGVGGFGSGMQRGTLGSSGGNTYQFNGTSKDDAWFSLNKTSFIERVMSPMN